MVNKILSKAGFVRNKTYRETRFLKAPTGTYAVYNDSYARRGSDDLNLITEHDYTVEVYSETPDPEKERAIEDALDSYGIPYSKDERYWIQDEQLYQVVYSFDYIEK